MLASISKRGESVNGYVIEASDFISLLKGGVPKIKINNSIIRGSISPEDLPPLNFRYETLPESWKNEYGILLLKRKCPPYTSGTYCSSRKEEKESEPDKSIFGEIKIPPCYIHVVKSEITLEDSIIEENLFLINTFFHSAVSFSNVVINKGVNLSSSYFFNGLKLFQVTFKDSLNFNNSDINNAFILACEFHGESEFYSAKFNNILFDHCIFNNTANFVRAEFVGSDFFGIGLSGNKYNPN